MNILVIEDEEMVMDLICRMLEAIGHNPICAVSWEEALDQFQNNDVDCTLMDFHLTGEENGRLLADKIKGLDPKALILFTTGELIESILLNKGEDVLYKPFSVEGLQAAIEKLVSLKTIP